MNATPSSLNAQDAGPLHVGHERTDCLYAPDGQAVFETLLNDWNTENPRITRAQRAANARLGAAAYSAFDKAGRELGVDATELATALNILRVINELRRLASFPSASGTMARAIISTLPAPLNEPDYT